MKTKNDKGVAMNELTEQEKAVLLKRLDKVRKAIETDRLVCFVETFRLHETKFVIEVINL